MKILLLPIRAVLALLEGIRKLISPLTDPLLDKLTGARVTPESAKAAGMHSFEVQADGIMSTTTTYRAQTLVRCALLVVVAMVTWAALAEVDEVTKGDGKVVPSKQLQVIQALDGGFVTEILVAEGDVVDAGQVLLRIDGTRATSGVRESAAQTFSLKVKLARLKALSEGSNFSPPEASNQDEQAIIDEETQLYLDRTSQLGAMISINQQQLAQRRQELSEMQARRESAARSLSLARQELDQTKPLLASGAVSEVEILRLDREVSRNRGDMEQAAAQSSRVQASISEATRKIQETDLTFKNEARRELSETMGKLNAMNEGAVALADRVDKANVKSPVKGRVQRLFANTVGGVIQPGRDIVEIIPIDDALVLEAKISPKDIGFIHPGQAATVKFSAYDFSIYGGLDATVENISPSTETDERGQQTFYVIRVKTKRNNVDPTKPIIPGMTAEVDILTGKKTVLSYLLKPVLRAHSYALRER